MPKKILVVVESIDVESGSGAKANVALIRSLENCGNRLKVYHYSRKDIHLQDIDCIAIKENRKSLYFFLSRLIRHCQQKFNLNLNKILERIFGFSFTLFNDRNSIAAGLRHIEDFNPDVVLTLSQGGSFRPHHALLKKPELQKKWVAYIHDPYPMHAYPRPYDWVEPGHQNRREFFIKVSRKTRYAAYPSQLLAEWMEGYYPSLKGKRVIIPHQIFQEGQIQKLPTFFDKHKFNIVHAGTLLSARNPLALVDAFKKFLIAFPEAKGKSQLYFLGPESYFSKILKEEQELTPELFVSHNSLPFAEVLTIQRSASVNVILEAKGPISPFLPGKFPHCVAADKPILLLGPFYSECKRLLGEDYKFWSEINDCEKIFELIVRLFQEWNLENNRKLNRPDLIEYLSEKHLKIIIDEIFC